MVDPAHQVTDVCETDRRMIARRLRYGLGVEDIAVRTGIAEHDIRACIAYWRRWGYLWRILWGRNLV